ncbi:MAG TPA: AMP-binding protein, partial [Flavobacteriaceae bacterium]|nr:AMP-binding protein [Flavobacteriaceae bacterium]
MDQILWKPTKTDIIQSNIYKMMHKFGFSSYQNFWQWSVNYKATFWEETITNLNIPFVKKYTVVLDTSNGVENATWLKNAKLNIVDACFTHEDEAIAITYQNTNGKIQTVTYKQLKKLVNKIANSFVENGLKLGDKIAVLMPMTVEAVAVYLAGIKAGMPIVTIADSFTPNEIDIRLKITAPKLLITQNSFKRGDKTISLYSKVKSTNAPKSI